MHRRTILMRGTLAALAPFLVGGDGAGIRAYAADAKPNLPNGTIANYNGTAWIVWAGKRHGYTGHAQFDRIHKPGARIQEDTRVELLEESQPIGQDAVLLKARGSEKIYFFFNGKKWWIPNWETFTLLQFDRKKIQGCDPGVLDSIPNHSDTW